jgi:hypothetical protein
MTPLTAVMLAADINEEGQLPVWLALALIAQVLVGGVYAATRPHGHRSTGPQSLEPLGHPLDRIEP